MASTLHLETWGEYQPPTVSVRIKRQSDLNFFDYNDGTFKAESACTRPFVPLAASASPNSPNNVEVAISMNPAQWTDGDYTVYYHDASVTPSKVYCIGEVSIFGGSPQTQSVPTTTAIAGRILDGTVASHTVPGSVGAWLIEALSRIKAIQTKVGA